MSHYWRHDDDFDNPPLPSEVTHRRPSMRGGRYWESLCHSRADALDQFWNRWERTTGCRVPLRIRALRPSPQPPGLVVQVSSKTPDEHRVQRTGESGT